MATPVVSQSTAASSYALAAGTNDCICVMMVQLHSASHLKKKDSNTIVVFIIWMGKIPRLKIVRALETSLDVCEKDISSLCTPIV